jgi:hypothetical protein
VRLTTRPYSIEAAEARSSAVVPSKNNTRRPWTAFQQITCMRHGSPIAGCGGEGGVNPIETLQSEFLQCDVPHPVLENPLTPGSSMIDHVIPLV